MSNMSKTEIVGNEAGKDVPKKGRKVKTMDNATETAPANTDTLALIEKKGATRGRNPREITYKILNRVPKSLNEFANVAGASSEGELCEYLFDGYNASQYSAASDEIGEFINDSWDKDTQTQFRATVRNYAKMLDSTVEDVVGPIKEAVEKAWQKKVAKAAEEAAAANATPAQPTA